MKALDIMVLGKKIFNVFPIQLHLKHLTPGAEPILNQGHDLNKSGGGSLDNLTYQIWKLWV